MPTAIILAGPNGAGKTTFAQFYLSEIAESPQFLNADEIARELSDMEMGLERDMGTGRRLLARLDQSVQANASFVLETTLSSRLYAKRIPAWRRLGYRIALLYLRLPSAEASLKRVRHRVSLGGHDVHERDVLRRFARSAFNLEAVYKPLVDEWQIWESRDGMFDLIERSAP